MSFKEGADSHVKGMLTSVSPSKKSGRSSTYIVSSYAHKKSTNQSKGKERFVIQTKNNKEQKQMKECLGRYL